MLADVPRHARPIRVCLAGSGGGHLRQLLDLEAAWTEHDAFFVTEDTALGRSVAAGHRTHFVPHLALGQGRLGAPVRMVLAAVGNFFRSAQIAFRERPQIVVSTGAGAMFFTLFWSRLLGAQIVVVESFARFDHPSVFARLAAPLAHHKVVQSQALSAHWPDAEVFDPLRILDAPRPPKQPLLFATVGATLPFDRLVRMVAEVKASGQIPEQVVAQVGLGAAPVGGELECVETLSFEAIQARLRDADIVVCHGGTGSLITALRNGCRVIAVPRLFSLGEHYDDHQAQITKAFEARGLIAVANSSEELAAALKAVRSRPPILATTEPLALIEHLRAILRGLGRAGGVSQPAAAPGCAAAD